MWRFKKLNLFFYLCLWGVVFSYSCGKQEDLDEPINEQEDNEQEDNEQEEQEEQESEAKLVLLPIRLPPPLDSENKRYFNPIFNKRRFDKHFKNLSAGHPEGVYQVTRKLCPVRYGPDESEDIVDYLQEGDFIHVLGEQDLWLEVGVERFVQKDHVQSLDYKTKGLTPQYRP